MGGDNFKPNEYSRGAYNQVDYGFKNIWDLFNRYSDMPNLGMPQAPTMPSMSSWGGTPASGYYGINGGLSGGTWGGSGGFAGGNVGSSYRSPLGQGGAGGGGVLSGVTPYNLPSYSIPSYDVSGYSVPNTSSIMPTTEWWNSMSPDVKAGAWQPFAEGQKGLMETLGGSGMAGSARGGYSGAAGAALGQYMADATPQYAMNLWNMSSPGMMAGWQGQLGQNQYLAGQQNQRAQWGAEAQLGANQWGAQNQLDQNKLLYQNQLAERTQDYQNEMARQNQNYAAAMQGWQMPFNMATNYNNLLPSGAYHSDNGGTLGSIMGAASSIAGPLAMGWGMGGFQGKGGGGGSGYNNLMFNPYMGGNVGMMGYNGTFGR